MESIKEGLSLAEESLRLEIKRLALETKMIYSLKGLSDIFDVLEDISLFIRKPLDTSEISGFTTYFDNQFIVFLNSTLTLGHERFTAAHELYYILYNADILRKEKLILNDEKYKEEDKKANIFAAEFLMPEDYVKELFFKLVNVDKSSVEVRHVVRLNSTLKVSYKAMLKRLIQLNLCDRNLYKKLVEYGSVEKKEILREITKKEGYDISLIIPSNITFIPKEYIEIAKMNYEKGKISYGRLARLLSFINKTPEDYGYLQSSEDDLV